MDAMEKWAAEYETPEARQRFTDTLEMSATCNGRTVTIELKGNGVRERYTAPATMDGCADAAARAEEYSGVDYVDAFATAAEEVINRTMEGRTMYAAHAAFLDALQRI